VTAQAAVDDAAKAGTFDGIYVSRAAHSPQPGAAIVRRATGCYLNAFHRRLAKRENDAEVDDGRPLYVLDVVRSADPSRSSALASANTTDPFAIRIHQSPSPATT